MAALAIVSVGQRYTQPDDPQWNNQVVSVSAFTADAHGFPLVTFQFPDGREVSAYASQVSAAVAAGHLIPVPSVSTIRAA
jgi:hypothetical protein